MILQQIRPALVLLVLFTALTGIIYPMAITGVAAVVFPNQAQGSLVEREGTVGGSSLIGQNFFPPLLPSASIGDERAGPAGCNENGRRALQRGEFVRLKSGPAIAKACRSRKSRCRGAAKSRAQPDRFRPTR